MKLARYIFCVAAGTLAAQSPQPSFENDQVVINAPHPNVDVPGSTHKMHEHKLNRVMVYMHPGGENLHYLDGHTGELKWKEGEVQWSPASGPHYSEIPPELDPRVWKTPAFTGPMIVDIGIKKPGVPGSALAAFDPKLYRLELENSQVRVLRLRLAPHQRAPMEEHSANRLIVCMTDQNVRVTRADGKTETQTHKAAEFVWENAGKSSRENLSDKAFEAVVVEFKS
jgi:hypothetical protein